MNEHTCPVCGYNALEFPPRDHSICACCGTEFGYDDRVLTHQQLRDEWVSKGCLWFDCDERRAGLLGDPEGPHQIETPDDQSRVAPLKAGADGQDLPRRSSGE